MDLREILDYIAVHNRSAAFRLKEKFQRTFNLLSEHPEVGHIRPDITQKSLRFWQVERYAVIYREGSETIEIVRVLSAYRDITSLL